MIATREVQRLELWGGVECTVNRLGDRYLDQIERSGHGSRPEDLELFAGLGIRTLRYPVLWERTAPGDLADADWSWPDARLSRLRALGITPIVGLVHHGSGPRSTHLLDPGFPERLADFAGAVARRYPWITHFTPVNEPLTTARFSALYGHWYPHERNPRAFVRALLNECRGVVLAMERIRQVTPHAQLVQTEDLGKVFSTPRLAYQARFENERRWLTFDLLCGRLARAHPMWKHLRRLGIAAEELNWFPDHACPPDILGVNYYLTSERFLDDRVSRYPVETHGGNGRHAYADVEAVRVRTEGMSGPYALLSEAWQRYRLPMAVTEVHNGCTREEQMRWFLEVWSAAKALLAEGVDIRAVTPWALLGTYDWNSLVTRETGHYEPGAFDLRAPEPRRTALAGMIRDLTAHGDATHPVLGSPGWWRRPRRFAYGVRSPRPSVTPGGVRRLLVSGAGGTLGRVLVARCEVRGLTPVSFERPDLDIADPDAVAAVLDRVDPWAVVNAAGYVRVDEAERDRARCFRENSDGPAVLADACRRRGIAMVTFSSDLVFDGARREPYDEDAEARPLGVYGESKLDGERRTLGTYPEALVIRTSAFFGPWDEHNFVTAGLRALSEGRCWVAADDAVVSPTYVPDLVDAALDLLIDGERGVWHLANQGAISWYELARKAAVAAGADPGQVLRCSTSELALAAPRPAFSALGSRRGWLLSPLDEALARYMEASGDRWRAAFAAHAGREALLGG
ncbi:MAG TPA: family 1 glycosylhydrolase [Gemmatimonadales bacterium]|nr:family 1 glycosylhydrolase [Gemmatimonadales bacterium]